MPGGVPPEEKIISKEKSGVGKKKGAWLKENCPSPRKVKRVIKRECADRRDVNSQASCCAAVTVRKKEEDPPLLVLEEVGRMFKAKER